MKVLLASSAAGFGFGLSRIILDAASTPGWAIALTIAQMGITILILGLWKPRP